MIKIVLSSFLICMLYPFPLAAQSYGFDSFSAPVQRGAKFNEPDRGRVRDNCAQGCAERVSPGVGLSQNRDAFSEGTRPYLGAPSGASVGAAPLARDPGDQQINGTGDFGERR